MSRREQRLLAAMEEAQRVRRHAETEVVISKWDLDPAKQYVRRYGWLKIIRDYVNRRHHDGVSRPLKFLTLPGPNASDIGLLWKERILQQTSDGKLNVAICDKENAQKVAANLGDLGGPLAFSDRLLHEELADSKGVFNEHFPFDVVNLDMCQCLIPLKSTRGLVTLRWLFRLQRGQAFLLLLTTKPDESAQQKLLQIISENLDNEQLFRDAYEAKYGNDNPVECLRDYTTFTQIVFPKVIARMARHYGYRTQERFAGRYERKNNDGEISYDMVCHSLEFEPLGRTKKALKYSPIFREAVRNEDDELFRNHLSSRTLASAFESYGEFIEQLPTRDPINVIEVLRLNAALEQTLSHEARSLQQWWI
jgi:hypothetical protein